MNGFLLFISRPPSKASTTIHTMCLGILTSFGYKDKFLRLTMYKNTPVQYQKPKILEEGCTTSSHRGNEKGPLPTPHTAHVPRFDRLWRSTPYCCFWTIRALMWHGIILCYRDHKRHDNFTDIGICPKTGAQPRKLLISDMDDDKPGRSFPVSIFQQYREWPYTS